MPCGCIEEANEKLAEYNTRLLEPWIMNGGDDSARRLCIETEQIETGRGKKKAVAMFTTFCPFCGVKQEADEVVTADA